MLMRLRVHVRRLNVLDDGLTVLMVIGAALMRCGHRHMVHLMRTDVVAAVLVRIRVMAVRWLLVMVDDDLFVMRQLMMGVVPAGRCGNGDGRKGGGEDQLQKFGIGEFRERCILIANSTHKLEHFETVRIRARENKDNCKLTYAARLMFDQQCLAALYTQFSVAGGREFYLHIFHPKKYLRLNLSKVRRPLSCTNYTATTTTTKIRCDTMGAS